MELAGYTPVMCINAILWGFEAEVEIFMDRMPFLSFNHKNTEGMDY